MTNSFNSCLKTRRGQDHHKLGANLPYQYHLSFIDIILYFIKYFCHKLSNRYDLRLMK